MVELLPNSRSGAFESFCSLLENLEMSWLSEEIKSDLKAEMGSLEIEDYVHKEAGALVHRHFGTSKRFSERDKKEIQELVAMKAQTAKEAWRRQLEKTKIELDQQRRNEQTKDTRLQQLNERLNRFKKLHQNQLFSLMHDMKSTSDVLRVSYQDPSKDYLLHLEEKIDVILRRMSLTLRERETLLNERERCLKVLNIQKKSIMLDQAMKGCLDKIPEQLEKSRKEVRRNEQIISKLKKQICDLEEMLNSKDATVNQMRVELAFQEDKIGVLEKTIQDLTKRLDSKDGKKVFYKNPHHNHLFASVHQNGRIGSANSVPSLPRIIRDATQPSILSHVNTAK